VLKYMQYIACNYIHIIIYSQYPSNFQIPIKTAAPTASVMRDGDDVEIPAREQVPCDISVVRLKRATMISRKTQEVTKRNVF
jgi:hypothetical protein